MSFKLKDYLPIFKNERVDVLSSVAFDPGAQGVGVIDFNAQGEAGAIVTIGGVAYLEGATGQWLRGANAGAGAVNLAAAINADVRAGSPPFAAVVSAGGHSVIVTAERVGTGGNLVITTTSAGAITVENMHGGRAPVARRVAAIRQTVTAQDALAAEVNIPLPFAPTSFSVQVLDANGVVRAITSRATIQTAPNRIRIVNDGATNPAATNVASVVAIG